MYKINVNFLKDRKLDSLTGGTSIRKQKQTPIGERLPILIGGGVGAALIAFVGGAWILANSQKSQNTKAIAQLDAEIQRLQGQSGQVAEIQAEIDQINQKIAVLVSVFEQIKPWSAVLAEIGAITPETIQIKSLNQSGGRRLNLSGTAKSHADVNDFVLSLKNSPLISTRSTRLNSTSWTDNPSQVVLSRAQLAQNQDQQSDQFDDEDESELPALDLDVSLPEVVNFSITTRITSKPSQQLIDLLRSRGAIGLVKRIDALRARGALDAASKAPDGSE